MPVADLHIPRGVRSVPGLGFRLIRNVAHFVLQWCMNSTASFQSWCLKRRME